MLRLKKDNTSFRYHPYPIGLSSNVFEIETYNKLVNSFPDESLFKHMGGAYNKYSLSEVNNPQQYQDFVSSVDVWRQFHKYVKSQQFFVDVLSIFKKFEVNVDLKKSDVLKSRFEFSSLPSGGYLDPHTDIPSKIITLVLPMVSDDSWNLNWDGSTRILSPIDPFKNHQDYKCAESEFEMVDRHLYLSNACTLFMKTFNSWHSVRVADHGTKVMRRTLTVNIEKK